MALDFPQFPQSNWSGGNLGDALFRMAMQRREQEHERQMQEQRLAEMEQMKIMMLDEQHARTMAQIQAETAKQQEAEQIKKREEQRAAFPEIAKSEHAGLYNEARARALGAGLPVRNVVSEPMPPPPVNPREQEGLLALPPGVAGEAGQIVYGAPSEGTAATGPVPEDVYNQVMQQRGRGPAPAPKQAYPWEWNQPAPTAPVPVPQEEAPEQFYERAMTGKGGGLSPEEVAQYQPYIQAEEAEQGKRELERSYPRRMQDYEREKAEREMRFEVQAPGGEWQRFDPNRDIYYPARMMSNQWLGEKQKQLAAVGENPIFKDMDTIANMLSSGIRAAPDAPGAVEKAEAIWNAEMKSRMDQVRALELKQKEADLKKKGGAGGMGIKGKLATWQLTNAQLEALGKVNAATRITLERLGYDKATIKDIYVALKGLDNLSSKTSATDIGARWAFVKGNHGGGVISNEDYRRILAIGDLDDRAKTWLKGTFKGTLPQEIRDQLQDAIDIALQNSRRRAIAAVEQTKEALASYNALPGVPAENQALISGHIENVTDAFRQGVPGAAPAAPFGSQLGGQIQGSALPSEKERQAQIDAEIEKERRKIEAARRAQAGQGKK